LKSPNHKPDARALQTPSRFSQYGNKQGAGGAAAGLKNVGYDFSNSNAKLKNDDENNAKPLDLDDVKLGEDDATTAKASNGFTIQMKAAPAGNSGVNERMDSKMSYSKKQTNQELSVKVGVIDPLS